MRPSGPSAPYTRFSFIDAWRGIAALWVAFYHFYGPVSHLYQRHLFIQPIHYLLAHGNAGVDIFFVISGYVIAYSIRQKRITPRFFGLFMLRRSIRLEPTYWATIALAIAVLSLSNHLRPEHIQTLPTCPQIIAHLFYLQGFFHVDSIVGVFWTLCVEVQFYIVFLLLVAISQSLGDSRLSRLAVLVPLTITSVGIQAGLFHYDGPWMLKFWYLFQLGVVGYWAVSKQLRDFDFMTYALLVAVVLCWQPGVLGITGWFAGVGFYLAGRYNLLGTLDYRPVQFLGSRSYSLYLIHFVIGMPFVTFLAPKIFGPNLSLLQAIPAMAVALVVSIVGASFFYRFIERPSIELGRSLKQKTPRRLAINQTE